MNGAQITFFGRVTRDPELRYTANEGTSYLTMSVAVNTYRQNRETETNYFEVTLWRARAEAAHATCHRGTMVFVQGRFSQREYKRRDGQIATALQVDATEFRNLSPAAPQPEPGESPDQEPQQAQSAAAQDNQGDEQAQDPQQQATPPQDFADDINIEQDPAVGDRPY